MQPTFNASLPVAWRLQWDRLAAFTLASPSRFGSSFRLAQSESPSFAKEKPACALTVAGQWRNLTALPEHSVAGNQPHHAAAKNQPAAPPEKLTPSFKFYPI